MQEEPKIEKDCPFCKVRSHEAEKVNSEQWAVCCNNCGAMGPMALTKEDAVRCGESRA